MYVGCSTALLRRLGLDAMQLSAQDDEETEQGENLQSVFLRKAQCNLANDMTKITPGRSTGFSTSAKLPL